MKSPVICNSMGETGRYTKGNKQRQLLHDITYMWNLKESQIHRNRVEIWLPGGEENRERLLMSTNFLQDKSGLRI